MQAMRSPSERSCVRPPPGVPHLRLVRKHHVRFICTSLLLYVLRASAQELEPRAYSPAPVGTNFIGLTYTHLGGQILTDPSLPVTDVQAGINSVSLGYLHVFDLAGSAASLGLLAPFVSGDVSGNVFDSPNQIHRAGMGDLRVRFAMDLLGGPALTPDEFAHRVPDTVVGASLTIVAPTGQYEPAHLINVGSNRWAFKPEFGISQPLGNWFAEVTAGVWLFTDNDSFAGNRRRSQAPLAVLQLHGGYTFRPGLWLAVDAGFFAGGATSVNGVRNDDRQDNSRFGVTLSIPITRSWSAKLAASKGVVVRAGGNYNAISLTLQYLWFNR
ncbi:outer membrane putative beta-barrel porin/alpha-amylase [Paraburkholderia sp. BL27I4N3]|nr:outer membrane putative beta-barrel porin/alpha-amylase [Paraburkholderia sp. BL27I4N3]